MLARRKRKLIITAFLTFMITISSCIPVLAANDSIEDSTDKCRQNVESYVDERFASSEEDKQIIDRMLDGLENSDHISMMDGHDEDSEGNVKNAKKVIDEVVAEGFGYSSIGEMQSDINASTFADNWYVVYSEMAKSYDIPTGDDWFDKDFGQDEAERVEVSAARANILTWDRKVDRDGNPMGETFQGKILQLINKYDSEFSTLMQSIAAIAVALTLAFGTANLLSMTQERMISSEALIREFLKILLGAWVILNYRYFVLLIIRVGTLLTEAVFTHDASSSISATAYKLLYSSLQKTFEYGGPTSATVKAVSSSTAILDWIKATLDQGRNVVSRIGGVTITRFATDLVIYAVAIEIGIRYVFTPIAIADLYNEKFRSNGYMWMKKLLAVSMQGALIFLVIFGTQALKDIIGGFGLQNAVINIVMMGMFAGSRLIANEIVGAH